ncbi:MAG: type II restriction endonuclease subunit M [Bacteroidia bacterium]|nr:type II restriction endonuclease subunit M [Bacteroidia bacterium]
MPILSSAQRKALEKTVIQARSLAETGAANALRALAVDHHEPFAHMDPKARELRNRLRAKGREAGDQRHETGRQEIQLLSYELAYEFWHKMLFARFLEANGLLMHPDGVAVSLDDCQELAPAEGFADKWDIATAYASRMLPAIFRPDDPLMQLRFATEDRIALEKLLDALEPAIFTADDSLGWTYQFWQSEAKDAINKSGDKIDGSRLPAVTQLFTEPYMVHFLIDNTLGAWWVSRHPGTQPPVDFAYLRLNDNGTPAAGRYEGWPERTAEVTVLDPCMGSGHFIATIFPVLARLRMHEEGLSPAEATDRVLSDNLHGLELDPRCTQIAAFNLALTAWKFCGTYRELPDLQLACSGVAPRGKAKDWAALGGDEPEMQQGMSLLFLLFQNAPELGSLLDPGTVLNGHIAPRPEALIPALERAIARERNAEERQRGVVALGVASAAKLLAQKYVLQITNVPYLSRGKQDEKIRAFCEEYFPDSKSELANVFFDRMLAMNHQGGTSCTVMPQNWLFLTSYSKLRKRLLKEFTWNFIAKLGEHAFESPAAAGAFASMAILSKERAIESRIFAAIDVSNQRNEAPIYSEEKASLLRTKPLQPVDQARQLENPDARVVLGEVRELELLEKYSEALVGMQTSDDPRFIIRFWEITPVIKAIWEFLQGTPEAFSIFDGGSYLVRWEEGKGVLLSLETAYPTKGLKAVGKKGIAIHRMGSVIPYHFNEERFHQNVAVILPHNPTHLPAIWAFCSSPQFNEEVRKIDQSLKVTNATLGRVPFDLAYWQKVAAEQYPGGLPQPYSEDPTQWLFHGHPQGSEAPLQVALARLLGYRWPAESDPDMELAPEARQKIAAIAAFNHLSDQDGIVCIPSVNGEAPAAERLRAYLAAVWGDAWTPHSLDQLLAAEGSRQSGLEAWLRDSFFAEHCKRFQNRPFLWHIWDGRKDGFSALVNYHRLDRKTLQTLIYTYLGDWIRQCEAKVKRGDSGADGLLLAASQLKDKLLLILEGEPPYDIFVRWKPLAEQPLGWDPDLNDGVRLNIRPFVEAGILRKPFNIKWGVDRGKNPPGAPWGEVRDNDLHLGLEEKRRGRNDSI